VNGCERIQAALAGRRPDRTPVMLHNFMLAAHEAGYTMGQFRKDPRKIAHSFIRAVETYGYDGILMDVDTASLAGAMGALVDFPELEPARVIGGCFSSLEELDTLRSVDISTSWQISVWLEAVSLLRQHFGNEIFIRGNCDPAPFSLACMLRGAEDWMVDLLTAPEKCHQLLEVCTGASSRFIRLMSQAGAHMLSNGDSYAGPAMVSPAMYETFALPYEQRVIKTAHDCGLPYTLHICGNTNAILEMMMRTVTDAVELDYKTDAAKAREACRERVTFIGNIDPSGVIALGKVEDVRRETRKLLEVFAQTPRFILNAGCAIPRTAPAENIRALIEAASGR
jgi:MtaA/CmuA family methyltransferase